MKTNLCFRPKCLALILITCVSLFMFSCRKTDKIPGRTTNVVEKFFELPPDASPVLKRIVEDLKEKNLKHPFVEQFVAREGYPLWKYTKFHEKNPNLPARENIDGTDTLVSIPVVPDTASFVKDVLRVKLNDDILYKLFRGEEYESYGFDNDPNRTTPNANDMVGLLMGFEKEIFGQQSFEITDNKLFDYWGTAVVKPERFYVTAKFASYLVEVSYVCGWTTGGNLEGCPPGVDHCFNLVPIICTDSWTFTTWEDEGEGGDGDGWSSSPSGSSPGGGQGGNTYPGGQTNPPNQLPSICDGTRGWVRIIQDPVTGVWKNPCSETPVPIPPDCNYTEAQAQAMLDGSNGTTSISSDFLYGPSTFDANGVERKSASGHWMYYDFKFFSDEHVLWFAYFKGVIYRNSNTDPWKWESFTTAIPEQGHMGPIPTCFGMNMTANITVGAISADKTSVAVSLVSNGSVTISCLNNVEVKSINVSQLSTNFLAGQ